MASTIVDDAAASGLRKVTSFDAGDWLAWDPVNFTGIAGRSRSRGSGQGTIALRWDAADAEPFATVGGRQRAVRTTVDAA